MKNTNNQTLRVKSNIKAGLITIRKAGRGGSNNETGVHPGLAVRTGLKAGIIAI